MTHGVLTTFDDPEALTKAAADQISQVLRNRSGCRPLHIALAGGSTPRPIYEQLASSTDLDWNRVHIYWSDERRVTPDHPNSNYRMTRETLLDHIPLRSDYVHRMRCELDPYVAADEYEQVLRDTFCLQNPGELPRFDLILLGMGGDGHTASLFPGTAALDDTNRLVVANHVPQQDTVRITLTFPVLNAARNVCFLVKGEDKAEALRDVFSDLDDGERPPAADVQPTDGTLRWLVDDAAARLLP